MTKGKSVGKVIRVKHSKNFIVLDKGFLEDERLSFKAKGILTCLLSKPDNWVVSVEYLVKISKESKSAVRSGLKELEEAGYYSKVPVRNEEGTRILRWESTVYEVPEESIQDAGPVEQTAIPKKTKAKKVVGAKVSESTQANSLVSDFQEIDELEYGKSDTNKELNIINNELNKEYCASDEAPHTQKQIEHFFDVIWEMYPRKRNKGKVSLVQKKLLETLGIEHLSRAIDRYIQEQKANPWREYKNGDTFFNSGYVDYLDANFVPLPAKTIQPIPKRINQFNNFPQRSYDFDALEKVLLTTSI